MSSRQKGKNKSRHHTHAKKPSGAITPRAAYTPPTASNASTSPAGAAASPQAAATKP
jgi:hypothetical protein